MQVVIINGAPRSGKDTFCGYCDNYCIAWQYSSVDLIKDVAVLLGWDSKKDEKGRRLLSDLKDAATRYCDLPMKLMRDYREMLEDLFPSVDILFFHIREPEEIDRAKKEFNAITLLVKRPDAENVTSNHADKHVDDYSYDYTIYNNGTLAELNWMAE